MHQPLLWFVGGKSDSPDIHIEGAASVFKSSKKSILDEHKLRKLMYLILFERYTLRAAADAMQVSHMIVYRALQNIEIQMKGEYGKLYEKLMRA